MRVLNTAEMQEADRRAIEDFGIPALVLMENAALAVVACCVDVLSDVTSQRIAVVCGHGNNGGDGLAIARLLHNRGATVEVILLGNLEDLDGATRTNGVIAKSLKIPFIEVKDVADLEKRSLSLAGYDLIVDAIFGTGLNRPPAALQAELITRINNAASTTPVLAVDVPSGLSSDTGEIPGVAIHASHTVCLAAAKLCHVLPPARTHVGSLVVADISIPKEALELPGPETIVIQAAQVLERLAARPVDAHKGTFGHALVVAGSTGKSGAARLAGEAALRSGAGLVTVATAASLRQEVAMGPAELMTEALPEFLDDEQNGCMAEAASERVLDLLNSRSCLIMGPGLSTEAPTVAAIKNTVSGASRSMVLDADALNAYAGDTAGLSKATAKLVITPHPGEAARLLDVTTASIQLDRTAAARRLASLTQAVCVLKGHVTVIATPDGTAYLNPTGNAGMASAGMGDVLSGLIGGFVAQGLEPLDAALVGVYLHGLAGDLAVNELDQNTVLASDLMSYLSKAFRHTRHDD